MNRTLSTPLLLLTLLPLSAAGQTAFGPGRMGGVGAFDVVEATIPELQRAMASGQATAVDLLEAYLARIAAYDQQGPRLNAMIRLNPNARSEAQARDRERASGAVRGPLHGVPVILKDNYDTADMPTTGSSVALAGLVPPDDAFQVRKLREAGAVIVGKTNLHELAAGITTIGSLGVQTLNPYDLARYPDGSSGGTGAAVAASFAAVGWGTDTCGSIRIPAAQNNLFGLRPTKGLSSIDGIIPLSHTQDVGGPLARTVMDLAIALDATVGMDAADPATAALADREVPRFTTSRDAATLEGVRLGVLTDMFGDDPEDQEMGGVVRAAIAQMFDAGADVVDVVIPDLDDLVSNSSVIAHEFKWDLIDYLAATPGAAVGSLQDILDQGLYHAALESRFNLRNESESRDTEEYREALAKREMIREAVVRAMDEERLDALIYPTMRRPPAQIGDLQTGSNCQLSTSAGLPAFSIPAGFTLSGLPAGLELLGRPFADARLLALGFAFEQLTSHRRAPFSTPPLEGGVAPAPLHFALIADGPAAQLSARFVLDVPTGVLSYDLDVTGSPADEVHAVDLHRAGDAPTGPVIHRLSGAGVASSSGRVTLRGPELDALRDGRLYLSLYTREHPAGMARTAVCGASGGAPTPAAYPSTEMEWAGWLSIHPDTRVVSSMTGRPHDYATYPYGDYESVHNAMTFFPQGDFDGRRAPKERVLGVPYSQGGGIAFPFEVLQGRGSREVFEWDMEDQPVVPFWDAELWAAVVYEARVNGQLLDFFRLNRFVDGRFFDENTGSEWSFEGVAIAGPLEGTRLTQVSEAYVSFWFAWTTFVPDTFLMRTQSAPNEGNNAGKNTLPGDQDVG